MKHLTGGLPRAKMQVINKFVLVVILLACAFLFTPVNAAAPEPNGADDPPLWQVALVPTHSWEDRKSPEAPQIASTTSKTVPQSPEDIIEATFPDAPIMYWVALNESGLDEDICNPSGACGLFQIVGITWRNYGCVGDRLKALDNATCARKIYDANGLTDWRWSKYHGFDGGWGKRLAEV